MVDPRLSAAALRTLEAADRTSGRLLANARRLAGRQAVAPRGFAWVAADHWPLLARVTDRLNPARAAASAHARLASSLSAAGVGFQDLAPTGGRPGRLVVDPALAAEALAAIRRLGEDDITWHVAPIPNGVAGLPAESRRFSAPQGARQLAELPGEARVGQALTSASGHVVVAPPAWTMLTLQPYEDQPTRTSPWTVDVPIDAVYTWVDGTDPDWMAGYRDAAARTDATRLVVDSTVTARFAGHRELRYSLRALEQRAGWIRHVWIVTAGQVPGWLRREHPDVTIVDHRDIWPDPAALPTFNSHAIEANLHRIDGLAEHVLYFNDDVLLLHPATSDQYFTGDGRPRVFLSPLDLGFGEPDRLDPAPVAAGKNNRRLIEATYGRTPDRRLLHTPHAFRRSHMAQVAEQFADDFARTSASRFRSIDDIAPISLNAFAALAAGEADVGSLRARYIDPATRRAPHLMRRMLRHRDADVLCVNTVSALGPGDAVQDFLAALMPDPCSYENARISS